MEIEYVGTLVAKGPHSHKSLLLKNNDCSGRVQLFFTEPSAGAQPISKA